MFKVRPLPQQQEARVRAPMGAVVALCVRRFPIAFAMHEEAR